VKKIRGVAFALRVSPAMSNRIVESAKGILLKFIPDVYITTDHNKGAVAGRSPGI
jgi:RNA 3'-terminal phosphate cyclase-like protein